MSVMHALFNLKKKKMFRSQDITIFLFLVNPQILQTVRSSLTLRDIRIYTFYRYNLGIVLEQ